jgi:hypothetical protein
MGTVASLVAAVVGGAVGVLRMVVGGEAGRTVSRVVASFQAGGFDRPAAKIRAAGSFHVVSRSPESNRIALTVQ